MALLPGGTVTFVFTDIEGSTRLLQRLGDRYATVLGEHRRVLRAECGRHGGEEVGTEGDGSFIVFPRAGDAVTAVASAQRALAAAPWPEGFPVRVRMGVHTGGATPRDGDYVGLDVHRAARICSAGHGGQVLVSSVTRGLVDEALPADMAFRDLGEHRLKDLDAPERLFQLVIEDLPAEFPLLRAVVARRAFAPGALPRRPNRTIGREREIGAVAERVRASGVRLLTLTGPGGVGKTRLAMEAARVLEADFRDGTRFVSLAALRRPEDLLPEMLQSLGILPLAGESAEQSVSRFLSAKDLLLVLDNFEHLLGAAPFVSELLSACAALTVLATSREPLALACEERVAVLPLAVPADRPDDLAAVAGAPAVALFAERARAIDRGFAVNRDNAAAISEICRRLDGLPLAIELAAARCLLLSPVEIANRLEVDITALGPGPRDAPARQRTVRDVIDWSHELLSDAERACFARFAVFAGGATIAAAEAITHGTLETLNALVAKSLLVARQAAASPTRLEMLDTIRAYASQRLDASGDEAPRRDHYRYFLAVAQRHATEQAVCGAQRQQHLAVLDSDRRNLDAALEWAVSQRDGAKALSMVCALAFYWDIGDADVRHAVRRIDEAMHLADDNVDPPLRVRALCFKAHCLRWLGELDASLAIMAQAETLARQAADPRVLAQTLRKRADLEASVNGPGAGDRLAEEALNWARTARDEWEVANAAYSKATAAPTIAELHARVEWAADLLERAGNVFWLTGLFISAAYVALRLHDAPTARDLIDRATPGARALNDPYTWMILQGNRGLASLFYRDTDAAREALSEELRLARDLVVPSIATESLLGHAALAILDGDPTRAARLLGAAQARKDRSQHDDVARTLDTEFFEPARARYGSAAWQQALREGAALTLTEAIAAALR